jgi:hypothetical protein
MSHGGPRSRAVGPLRLAGYILKTGYVTGYERASMSKKPCNGAASRPIFLFNV